MFLSMRNNIHIFDPFVGHDDFSLRKNKCSIFAISSSAWHSLPLSSTERYFIIAIPTHKMDFSKGVCAATGEL